MLVFDQRAWRRHRGRAAARDDAAEFLFVESAAQLVERLSEIKRDFTRALDLGSRGGILAPALAGKAGIEFLVAADPAEEFVRRTPAPRLVAEPEALPFAPHSFDLVLSNLLLHWTNDLPGALLQLRHALKPGGLLLAALFGLVATLSSQGAEAKENWNTQCAKCHGADGKSDTKIGAKLGAKDFTDAKVQAAAADVATAKAERDAAVKAEADAQVAYQTAVNTPMPPPVVPLPAGTFTGDLTVLSASGVTPITVSFTGTSDSDEAAESAAVAQAAANVAAAQTALDQANAAKATAQALTPPDPAAVTAAQAGVDTATANKATADKALADAKTAQAAEEAANG